MLEALLLHLRRIRCAYSESNGASRSETIRTQAEQALTFALENGFLIEPTSNFEQQISSSSFIGSEHLVELDSESCRVLKLTKPNTFGLTPTLKKHPLISANPTLKSPPTRFSIEFDEATPIEYLQRWKACNEIFNDDVHLEKIIKWPDLTISFVISQPQYHGKIASQQSIIDYFLKATWTPIKNNHGHTILYNYAYDLLAMDIESRNCYISPSGQLLPFDVILSKPSEELENYLQLY